MSRLLMFIAIAAAIYLLIKSYGKKNDVRPDASEVEDMVRCAHCGVHLPRSESVKGGELFYCGSEHRDAGKKS